MARPVRWGLLERFERLFVIATLVLFAGPMLPLILLRGAAADLTAEGDPWLRLPALIVYAVTAVLVIARWRAVKDAALRAPFLMALLGLAVLSATWSIEPGVSLRRSISLAGTVAFGLYVAARFTLPELLDLLVGAMVAILVGALLFTVVLPGEAIMDAPHEGAWRGIHPHKNGFGNWLIWSLVTALAALVARPRRRTLVLGWIAVSLVLVVLSHSATALVVALGVLAAPTVLWLVRIDVKASVSLLCVVATLALLPVLYIAGRPGDVLEALGRDPTLTGRTDLWEAVWPHIAARPVLGHGYQVFWQADRVGIAETRVDADIDEGMERISNSHNGWIELVLDLGFTGGILAALALGSAFARAIATARRDEGPFALMPLLLLLPIVPLSLAEAILVTQNALSTVLLVALAAHPALRVPLTGTVGASAPRPGRMPRQGAVQDPGSRASPEPTPEMRQLAGALRRRMGVWTLSFVVLFSVLALAAVRQQPLYGASALVLLDLRPRQALPLESLLRSGRSRQENSILRSEIDILESPALITAVMDRLRLEDDPRFRSGGDDRPMLERYRDGLFITTDRNAFTVSIGFRHEDADLARTIADAHASAYIADQRRFREAVARETPDWLAGTLTDLRPRLIALESEVAHARSAMGAFGPGLASFGLERLAELNKRLALARADRLGQEARAASPGALADVLGSPVIQQLRREQAALAERRADIADRLGPRHPDVATLNARILAMDGRILSETAHLMQVRVTEAEASGREADLLAATTQSAATEARRQQQDGLAADALSREADALRRVFDLILARFIEVNVLGGEGLVEARVISGATQPLHPVFPSPPALVIAAGAMAVLLSTAIVLWLEWRRGGYHACRDMAVDTGLDVLGSVPRLRGRCGPLHEVVVDAPHAQATESVRALRDSLIRRAAEKRPGPLPKLLVTTSFRSGEGKSTLAAALARSLTELGLRVVLVDCDLRHPSVGRLFGGAPSAADVTDICREPDRLDDALQQDRRTALTYVAGPASGAVAGDLGADSGLHAVLAELGRRADWIILDTPPAGALPFGDTLLDAATDILMVVRAGETPRAMVKAWLERLAARTAVQPSLVLNAVETRMRANFTPADAEFHHRAFAGYFR